MSQFSTSALAKARAKFIDLLSIEGFVKLNPNIMEFQKEIYKDNQLWLFIRAYAIEERYSFVLYKYFHQEGIVHTGYLLSDSYLDEPQLTNYREFLCEEDMALLSHLMNRVKVIKA